MNLAALFKTYLINQRQKSPATIKNYVSDLSRFIHWFEERFNRPFSPSSVTPQVILLYKESTPSGRSFKRYNSSLRTFFHFLQSEGVIKQNPLVPLSLLSPVPDAWRLKAFKDYLYLHNASYQTIKNYIADVQQFLRWAEQVCAEADVFQTIDGSLIEEYKNRLLNNLHNTPRTVNRKLSSLRSYLRFAHEQGLLKKPQPTEGVTKEFYAPTQLATKSFPSHRKLLFHLRYTRPDWYRKYHSYKLVHHLHLALLIAFASFIGIMAYQKTLDEPSVSPSVLSQATRATRTINFQGTLLDSKGSPLGERQLRFALYNSPTASGAALLFEDVKKVHPNGEGNFSQALDVPNELFLTTPSLYLGVSVEDSEELSPRQQIATVGLSKNADSLRGLLPITQKGAGTENVVLALDSAGNLTIGQKASPTFQATGGRFLLSGETLVLATNVGSNTSVVIAPDGTGFIDLLKPVQNTSSDSVQIDDSLAVLATTSATAAFTIEQTGTGSLLSASSSGTQRFSVDWLGNTFASGELQIGGSFSQSGIATFSTGTGPVFLNGPTSVVQDFTLLETATAGATLRLRAKGASWITAGNVGIGTTDPSDLLHLTGDLRVQNCVKNASGSAIAGTCSSDVRLKKNIIPLDSILGKLTQLIPVRYEWRSSQFPQFHFGEGQNIGLIAQQVEKVFPELVTVDENGYRAIRFELLPFYLLQGVKELNEDVSQLSSVLRTGVVEAAYITTTTIEATEELLTNVLRAKEAKIDVIETNIISPLAQDSNISVSLENSKFEIRNSKLASGSAVASFDNQGNATFSGQLTASSSAFLTSDIQQLTSENASVAGTLRAGVTHTLLTITDGLVSLGPTSLTNTAIADQLSIGAPAGGLLLADNTVNVLGSTLELQPLKQGAVSLMAGLVTIDTEGELGVLGSATFEKDVAVKGILAANIVSPIPNQDLVIRLGAGSSTDLRIEDATGSAVLTINQRGDLTASGSGTFSQIVSKTFTVLRGAQEDISLTETVASASAGTATITAFENKRTIYNSFVTNDALVFITPTSDTFGQTPYVASQVPGAFTIRLAKPTPLNVSVNWWIIH